MIRALERSGDLNRALEYLPTEEEIAERRKAGEGLTRPELAIISKLRKNLVLPGADPFRRARGSVFVRASSTATFRRPFRSASRSASKRHRLRREIIATAITNSLINRMGPVFPVRAQDDTGADPAAMARAYSIAREVFAVRNIWAQIEALDNKIAGLRAIHGDDSNDAPVAAHELLAAGEPAQAIWTSNARCRAMRAR